MGNEFVTISLCFLLFGLVLCKNSEFFEDTDGVENDLSIGGRCDAAGAGQLSKPRYGFLPLPPKYNKFMIPVGKNSTPIICIVHLSIREILDVDIINGIVEMDTEMGISWIDWKIWDYVVKNETKRKEVEAFSGSDEEINLDGEFLRHIWKPDIFIEQMASVERTSLLSKLITLRFGLKNEFLPGLMKHTSRQTLKVRCSMEFHHYPADIQKCTFHIRSYSYNEEQMFLTWNPKQKVFLNDVKDPNYSFQISGVEPGEKLEEMFTTTNATCCPARNHSTVKFVLQIRRDLTYHVVQTCLPSVLLVFITWLCFLLPPDMIEPRIGISMTTLLTLIALFAAVRDQAPTVSYPMAIDVWMVFCIFFLFFALLIFTVIYWLRRRLVAVKAKDDELVSGGEDLLQERHVENYMKIARHIMRHAFVFFAITFIIFLILFPTLLLTSSKYLAWSPSENYNALKENRLLAIQETQFSSDRGTTEAVNFVSRFYSVYEHVIKPKLKEIRVEGDKEYESKYNHINDRKVIEGLFKKSLEACTADACKKAIVQPREIRGDEGEFDYDIGGSEPKNNTPKELLISTDEERMNEIRGDNGGSKPHNNAPKELFPSTDEGRIKEMRGDNSGYDDDNGRSNPNINTPKELFPFTDEERMNY